MRDRGLARSRFHLITPVGAHSVGDRGVDRPRSGLLRAEQGATVSVRGRGRA
jgi:hypothetical protein